MSAAVMSPLGTMSSDYTEENDLFHDQTNDALMDDNDQSVPDLSDDIFSDFDMEYLTEEADSKPAVFGGLNNLGNTCYLNSALQMLASLDHFRLDDEVPVEGPSALRSEFLTILERLQKGETVNPSEFKKAIDERSPLFVGYRQQDSHEFLTTLLDLLDADYKNKTLEDQPMEEGTKGEETEERNDDDQPQGPEEQENSVPTLPTRHPLLSTLPSRSLTELQNDDISQLLDGRDASLPSEEPPKEDAASLPQCKLIGGRAAVPMSGVTQLTMDTTEDELATAVSDSTQQEGNSNINQAQEDGEPSPIEDYFTAEVRSQLTCDSCKYTRSHLEKYLHLSLDIGSDSGSVEEGLRKFFAPENRQVKCERCFSETATQTLVITKLPRALLVHCKRFIVDISPDYRNITYRKNQSPFSFGDTLSASPDGILGEFLADDVEVPYREEALWSLHDSDEEMGIPERSYRIRSVVNHIGSSASCGHYTCDASRLYPNGERQWSRFNDARVSGISADEAMGAPAQRTAYMVMYEWE